MSESGQIAANTPVVPAAERPKYSCEFDAVSSILMPREWNLDSKFIPYEGLNPVYQERICFVTIRCRESGSR